MAFRMKHWIGLVVVGMTLAAIAKLPPSSLFSRGAAVTSNVRIRYSRLQNDFRWTAEALLRLRWSDSLSALTLASAEERIAVGLHPSDDVTEAMAQALEATVRREVRALPRYVPGVVFGYFRLPFHLGRTADLRTSGRSRTETYVGTRDGIDYCLQVRVERNLMSAIRNALDGSGRVPPITGVTGVCRLYLQYGMAGPGVQDWLEAGGAALAIEKGDKPSTSQVAARANSQLILAPPLLRQSRAFGFNVLSGGNRPIEADQCRAGIESACGTLFLSPAMANPRAQREIEIVRRSPVMSIGGAPLVRSVAYDEEYLLADLEAEFGADAFLSFWTSTQGVPEAFESAFDVGVGEWMTTWVDSVIGTIPPSPALPRSASSGSLFAIGLLAGIAFLRNRKRGVA